MSKKVIGLFLVIIATTASMIYFNIINLNSFNLNSKIIGFIITIVLGCIIVIRYFDYVIYVFNPGLFLTVIYLVYLVYGMSISEAFSIDHSLISIIIGLVILLIYGMYTSHTASKATEYNSSDEGLFDIVHDVIRLLIFTTILFSWGFSMRFLENGLYFGALIYLIIMFLITFYEFYKTTKNSLITMQRINPTQLQSN